MLVRNPYLWDVRVEKEARTLTAAGYQVTVVAEAAPGAPLREEREGTTVIRVPRPADRRFVRFFRHQRAVTAALVATEADIFHAHDSDALVPVAGAAARWSRPYVYDAHEFWLGRAPRGRSAPYRLLFRAYYAVVERRHVPRAAAVIAVSPPIGRHLERLYRLPSVDLVPNYPEVAPPRRPRDLRGLPGAERIPVDAPIVLHLGAVSTGRGIEQVIEALRWVPHAHLVLLGGTAGDRSAAVGRLAVDLGVADRVHRVEPVPQDEVFAYGASATLGIAPVIPDSLNHRYSLPNKLFQYMAAGLPVLASALPQMRDVVEGSNAGRVVDTADASAIGRAIADLLDDPERLSRMARHARQAVEERYNWTVAGAVLLDVYDRVRSSRLGGPTSAPSPAPDRER
jgi:glycosyltransferase involved in cell wall biosynthesis